ncbi:Long-chain-fatty-acid--CoA ligase [Entamoeba marina]
MLHPGFNDLTPPYEHITKKDDCILSTCQEQYWNIGSFLSKDFITSHTLYELFKHRCESWPDENCISYRRKDKSNKPFGEYIRMSAKQCLDLVESIGSGIISYLHLKRGDKAAIFSTNRWEWILTEYAFHRHGIVLVPLYATLTTDQLLHIMKTTDCETIFSSNEHLDRIKEMNQVKPIKCVCFDEVVDEVVDICLTELIKKGKEMFVEPTLPNIKDMCSIFFTSGTSGTPKGAVHTHFTIASAIWCFCTSSPFRKEYMTRGQVSYSYLPLAHVYEHQIDLTFLTTGGEIYMNSGNIRYFSDEIKMASPTFLIVVPRVLQKLYDVFHSTLKNSSYIQQIAYNTAYYFKNWSRQTNTKSSIDWDYWVFNKVKSILGGRIQLICNGSAPLSLEVYEWTQVCFDCIICQGYGLTETYGGCIGTIPGLQDARIMSVGRPCPGATFRLTNCPDLDYLVSNTPPSGEIEIKGDFLFTHYFNDEESTKEAFTDDGFFKSGDIGVLNDDGTISVVDRRKNMFKLSQGEYIAVEPLERLYCSHPFIEQFFVFGVSSDSFIVGVLVPDLDELKRFLENKNIGGKLEDIVSSDVVKLAVLKELDRYARDQGAKGYEVVKNIHIELEPFSEQNGLLTPSFKIRRVEAKKKYLNILNDLRKHII